MMGLRGVLFVFFSFRAWDGVNGALLSVDYASCQGNGANFELLARENFHIGTCPF